MDFWQMMYAARSKVGLETTLKFRSLYPYLETTFASSLGSL